MAIDATVILSALFFTICAIIVASAFLSRKYAQNKSKPNHQETRPEGATESDQPKSEVDESAQISKGKHKENKVIVAEDKKEDPVSVSLALKETVIADEPTVAEDEVSSVQEAQTQAAAVPEVASGNEAICGPTPVDVLMSDSIEVPTSKPVPEQIIVHTVPELIVESAPKQFLEPRVAEPDYEPVQEPEVDSEHALEQNSEPAPALVSELSSELVSELSSELLSESYSEPVSESSSETISGAIPEQVLEVITEQISEPSAEQISEAVPEHILEGTPEFAPELVPEVAEESEVAAAPFEGGTEAPNFKHGKKRAAKLDKKFTKEELEEEHRVQREQLAAIFKLLRDNHETFGEVTEEDVEEQLKLYTY